MRILFGTIEHFYAHWKNGKMMKNHAENVHIGKAGKIHSPNFKGVQNLKSIRPYELVGFVGEPPHSKIFKC